MQLYWYLYMLIKILNYRYYIKCFINNFILGVDTSVAVPLPCVNVCRLDIVADEHKVENSSSHIVRWAGTLPLKLPTLLTKIEKSLENEKLGNSALKAHFAALQEEWAKYNYMYNLY